MRQTPKEPSTPFRPQSQVRVAVQICAAAIGKYISEVNKLVRRKRSLLRMMRLHNSLWRVLLVMLFTLEATLLFAWLTSLLWKELLVESPTMFAKSPWLHGLLSKPMQFQLVSLPVLLAIWMLYRKLAKQRALKYIPAPFVTKIEAVMRSQPRLFGHSLLAMVCASRRGHHYETDLDLLEKVYINNDSFRLDLRYRLNRSDTWTAKRYLEWKYNRRLIGAWVGWTFYFGYVQVVLPLLALAALRYVPEFGWLVTDNPTLRNMASMAAVASPLAGIYLAANQRAALQQKK